MAYIELTNVTKIYNKKKIIDNISFYVNKGDVIGFLGANGAGKSTLMEMIVTLIKPTSGDILYDGKSIIKNPSIIRGNIGYVPQEIALYQELSGMDNLKYWGKTFHLDKKRLVETIENIKKIIGLNNEDLKKKVRLYSGGMKRRLNIGVALLNDPDIIVMDEPTVGIDIFSKEEILNVIKDLNKKGKTILYITHDFQELEQLCNKICIISSGKIIEFNNKELIFNDKFAEKNKFIQYYLEKFHGRVLTLDN